MNLRDFVNLLDEKGLLVKIEKEVDPVYEASTLMKLLDGKPLLFTNIKGHNMPVAANICSTRELVGLGLGVDPQEILGHLMKALNSPVEPENIQSEGYRDLGTDLGALPILTYYPNDGGPYIASGIAVAMDDELGPNASFHRAMRPKDASGNLIPDELVMRMLKRDLDKYIDRGLKEFAFCVGNAIPVLIGAAISAGSDVNELAIANALRSTPMIELDGHRVPQSEIVMILEVTGENKKEGPFLDLTETPDIVRDQRVLRVKKIYAREDSLFHGLLPGGLEHKTLMGMPREPTIYKSVGEVCDVKDVLITPGGASWLHGAVSIVKKNPGDGRRAIKAAFDGHASMKHVFVVDEDIDIHDPNQIEWAMALRFQGDRDLVIRAMDKGSSLDPSSDLATRETCKIGFDLTIPDGREAEDFQKPKLPLELDPADYI